jgi:hypothetical protein
MAVSTIPKLNPFIFINGSKSNVTISANGIVHFAPTDFISIPNGYSIFEIAGFSTNNSGVFPYVLTRNTDEWALQFRNITGSSITTTIVVQFILKHNNY